MAMGGGSSSNPNRVSNVRVTQSTQGKCVPAGMGQFRIHQSLMWMDGFGAKQESQGGKGGGKGSTFYLYYADVIAALCNGPVASIGNVWAGQSWLTAGSATEVISAQAVYSPAMAATLIADNGVAFATTYSGTYNDYGAPAATVLSGTDNAPLIQVPYGTTLASGEYSINPASIGTFAVTSCGSASGGNTVYNGTFTGGTSPFGSGASNAYVGFRFVIAGFQNTAQNDGTFLCVASTATSVTLVNANGIAETHAATAAETGYSYHFYSGDAGKSAVMSYQFSTRNFTQTETDLIPASGVITVGGTYNPFTDLGVVYYNEGETNETALTRVNHMPTAAGTYYVTTPGTGDYSGGANYYFYVPGGTGGDFEQEVLISWSYANNSAVGQDAPNSLNFELFGGGRGQAIWPYILDGGPVNAAQQANAGMFQGLSMPAFPGAALGYSNTAYVAYGPMSLGDSGEIQDNTFEVITPDSYGGGIVDCNPVQCVYQVLTNSVWGLGSSPLPFPVSVIDNGASGTWGSANETPGTRQSGNTAWNWFAANSFFISPVLDNQETASSTIEKWLEAGACAAFMSEGLLKLVPYGTQSCAGNGCTWVAPSTFVVALDDTCFVAKEGEDPVKVERATYTDGWNQCQVNWDNRQNQYANELTQDFDPATVNRWGQRLEEPQDYNFIHTTAAAVFAVNMRVKRSVNIRNTYTFNASFIYSYLEPMDIVPITTSSVWAAGLNNTNLGVVNLPVRIIKVVDDPVAGLEITAEDSLFAAGAPVIYNKGLTAGNIVINQFAEPGSTQAVLFEATNRLTQQQGNEIWIGACGATTEWGGCNVLVSSSGASGPYLEVGTITAQARIGALADTNPSTGISFGIGSDPDTVNSLVVNMAENTGSLDAGTDADANAGNTLCIVDDEIIAYSACAVTAQNQYTMNGYIRRGQMGSTIAAHDTGALFMRLDSAVFKYTYDPTWAGQTLYFKFQSVNNFQNNPQSLETLTPVAFTVPGLNPGTIDASSGLIIQAGPNTPTRPVANPIAYSPVAVGAGALGWASVA